MEDEELKRRMYRELVELCLRDRLKCRELNAEGYYTRRTARNGEAQVNLQEALMQIAQGQQPEFPVATVKEGNGRHEERGPVVSR